MDEESDFAAQFEAHRGHLRAVALRMLGSIAEADDAVQESWLRVSRAETSAVENLGGWLTTVVARVCLDLLRARKSRREEPEDARHESLAHDDEAKSPEHDRLLTESLSHALSVVLETLAPTERVAFVLHDMFDLPFEEIASIVGTSSVAARQLASRARRRVREASPRADADAVLDVDRQREIVDAFLSASRDGDVNALVSLLDPNVVLRADRVAVSESEARQAEGAPKLAAVVRGAKSVAGAFAGRAKAAQSAVIDGLAGAVWAPSGEPRAAFSFSIRGGVIVAIELVADPEHLRELDIQIVNAP